MAGIKWEGNQIWGREYPDKPLPAGAALLRRPENILTASIPYMILPALICFGSVFAKCYILKDNCFDIRFILPGFLMEFLLLIVHEYLHAVCYPAGSTVYVGVCLKKIAAFAVCHDAVTRRRFLVMSLLPAVLGIIPLFLFWILPGAWKPALTVCMILAFMGLISPAPDYLDVCLVLKQVPKNAGIQAANDGIHWFVQ